MPSDFFRRFLLYSPEITNDVQTNGTLTLPTMTRVMGANPGDITNPRDARAVADRMNTAANYGIVNFRNVGTQMGQSSGMFEGGMPSFMGDVTFGKFARGLGRFTEALGKQVADMTYGPGAGYVLGKALDWSGLSGLYSNRLSDSPSPFMPQYLGGTAENPDPYEYPIPNWSEENQFNMTDPENLRNVGPEGQPATGLGTYRGGSGFVTGSIRPSQFATKALSTAPFVGETNRELSELEKRIQNQRR